MDVFAERPQFALSLALDRRALNERNPREQLCLHFVSARRVDIGPIILEGSLDTIHLPFRKIAEQVAASGAQRLILSHMHPSGDPRPSAADIATTRDIWRLGRLLGAPLVDHVIYAEGGRQFSFRDSGLL